MEPPWLRVISLSWFSTSAYIWDEHSRFCLTRWTVKLFTIIKLTTSELVFNAYRSLCDFTIILDYYYHLIYERNNNLWCEIILWRKYSPNLAGFQKELLISETLCNSIKKTLKICWISFSWFVQPINLKIIYHFKNVSFIFFFDNHHIQVLINQDKKEHWIIN